MASMKLLLSLRIQYQLQENASKWAETRFRRPSPASVTPLPGLLNGLSLPELTQGHRLILLGATARLSEPLARRGHRDPEAISNWHWLTLLHQKAYSLLVMRCSTHTAIIHMSQNTPIPQFLAH
jgi:hypothetical protein